MRGLKIYFLIHTQPLDAQKGREVLFVVREQDKEKGIYRSHNIIKEEPHIIVTRPGFDKLIDEDFEELKKEKKFERIEFEKVKYSKDKSFIRAFCSKEERKILPKSFICKDEEQKGDALGLNSPTRILRWLYPPFAVLDSLEIPDIKDVLKNPFKRFAPLENIINDKKAVIDIELENWEKDAEEPERIFMAVLYSDERKAIVHTLPFDDERFGDAELIRTENQEELVKRYCEIERSLDLLLRAGHNNMVFDDLKLRDLPEERYYLPGSDGHYPVTKATTRTVPAIKKVVVRGRHTMDTWPYFHRNLNIKKDNRLETHAGFEKSITYEEQSELVKKARNGSKEAFEKLVSYCIDDGREEYTLAYSGWSENVVLKALVFKRDANSICATSRKGLAEEYWKRRHFIETGNFEDYWKTHYVEEEGFHLDDLKADYVLKGFRRGLIQDVHVVYFTPFIRAFREFLMQSDARPLYEKLKREKDPDQKIDLAQTLNTFLTKPVKELLELSEKYNLDLCKERTGIASLGEDLLKKLSREDYIVGKKFGLPGQGRAGNLIYFNNRLYEAVRRINKALLNKEEIVNTTHLFHYITGELAPERMEEQDFGFYLGKGPVLSIEPGKAVANPYNARDHKGFIYQGLKIGKGKKSKFEAGIIYQMIEEALTGADRDKVYGIQKEGFDNIIKANKRGLLFMDVKEEKEEMPNSGEDHPDDWFGYTEEKKADYRALPRGYFGFSQGRQIPAEELLNPGVMPDRGMYKANFLRAFHSLLAAIETREKQLQLIV